MNLRPALLTTFASLAIATGAQAAQDPLLVQQGRLLAQSLCADCHTFGSARRSDRPSPDFADVGAMAQTTALSLRVFLRSPHATMPDIILEPEQIDALSAFILDLGGK
jgi:mono/diheme cytochrome c family protein